MTTHYPYPLSDILSHPRFSKRDELLILWCDLEWKKRISKGSYANVDLYTWSGKNVAVKTSRLHVDKEQLHLLTEYNFFKFVPLPIV
jgi:hypothetical protein